MPIVGGLRPLSAGTTAPAQVAIAPAGTHVVVTERATHLIDLFPIESGGLLGAPTFVPSVGQTPFGFEFGKKDTLIVSEAFGGAPDASAVSSYELSSAGLLTSISPSVPTTETAACWIAVTRGGRYAYATNTGSGTVSGYRVFPTGTIELLDADGVTGDLGAGADPQDASITRDNRFLYVLSPATNEIAIFAVRQDGSLEKLPSLLGVPSSARGLVAR
jgi:6-phosphogluconolactonase (cycloisomerase 2 family)